MAHLRAAETLGVQAAGFLALQRHFLRGAEPQPATDDIQMLGGLQKRKGTRPIELPGSIHEGRQLVQRTVKGSIFGPGGNEARNRRERR